jgi:hypothetical protein
MGFDMSRIAVLFALFAVLATPVFAEVCTDRINAIPDLSQTDPSAHFPYGGIHYCGPAAVSNSLMWLANNGYEKLLPKNAPRKSAQVQMICVLAEKYMETNLDEGTPPAALLEGVAKYIQDSGYRYERLEFEGWRKHPQQFSTGVRVPNLDWIKTGLSGDSAVWLNIGWYEYRRRTAEYKRMGGHWVTLAGFGVDQNGREDPNVLVIHDPSPKTGRTPPNKYLRLEPLTGGRIVSRTGDGPAATGFLRVASGMKILPEADLAILDGAVVLQMNGGQKTENRERKTEVRSPGSEGG